MAYNRALGAFGERIAAAHLIRTGHIVLARNWRCSEGEIDVVARDKACIVFCEVKTRRNSRFGSPVESVVGSKAERIRRLACLWLAQSGLPRLPLRFDVVTVMVPSSGGVSIEHIRNAF